MSDTPRTDARDRELHCPRVLSDRYSEMLDLARELERENNQLRAMLDNPHAVHAHYLRIGNGWEVWTTERVRGMEREIEVLRTMIKENIAVIAEQAEEMGRASVLRAMLAEAKANE